MTSFSRWHIIYHRMEDDLSFNLENVGGGAGQVVRNVNQELNIGYLRTIRGIGDIEVITSGNEIEISYQGVGGTGDFVGPDGATPDGVVVFGDATGKLGAEAPFRMTDEGFGAYLISSNDPDTAAPLDVVEVRYEGPNGTGETSIEFGDWQYHSVIHNPWARKDGGVSIYPVLHEGIDPNWLMPGGTVGSVRMGMSSLGSIENIATATFFQEYDHGSVNGAVLVNWNLGQKQRLHPNGDCVFTFSNPPGPGNFILRIEYGSTGPHTFTWPIVVKWPEDAEPDWTFINWRFQVVSFYFTGVEWAACAGPWMYSEI